MVVGRQLPDCEATMRALIIAGIVLSTLPYAGAGVELELRWVSAFYKRAVVSPTKFEVQSLEREFRQFLANKDKAIKVAKIEIFTCPESADRGGTKPLLHVSYEFWEFLYSSRRCVHDPAAELLLLGVNSAMRVRDSNDELIYRTLQGENPYVLEVDNKKLELVHLSLYPLGKLNGSKKDAREPGLAFFFKSEPPVEEQIARSALSALAKEIPEAHLSVLIRSDAWFISDPDFPIAPKFLRSDQLPPSKIEYERGAQWTCVAGRHAEKIHCWGQSERISQP
jgi:hypothetical protein